KYYSGAANGKNATQRLGIYNLTGYTCRKYIHPRDARTGSGNPRLITKTFPLIRYAEVLLCYAEALNNLTKAHEINGETYSRDLTAIADAFNQVRYRAGLPGAEAAELALAETFNSLIQRERMVEFLHENRRYYDICRWGIFEELEREPLTGLNVDANEWEGFYVPTPISHQSIRERSFKSKYMFMPLHRDELRKVPTLDQNPRWEK
ncbi:MAG: RagB/SusD family nutrient uptake outer membrane protein, partial [Alistipes sp.]